MNKRGFTTQDYLISGLLFTLVVIIAGTSLAGLQNNYPVADGWGSIVDEDIASNYNELENLTAQVTLMQQQALSSEGLEFRGLFDVTFGSFFIIMQLMFNTLNLFSTMLLNLVPDFPFIDKEVASTFLTIGFLILSVILIFRLINAVGRNKV